MLEGRGEKVIRTRHAGPARPIVRPMTNSILEDFAGSMTVGELCARTGRSVGALVEFCTGGVQAEAAAPPSRSKKAATSSRSKTKVAKVPRSAVETRTRAGREALDRSLVELLRGVKSGMSARDIAEETGASLEQIRSAVGRLVSKKKVRFEGKTAARRYWARG